MITAPCMYEDRVLSLSMCFRDTLCPPKAGVIPGWELSTGTKLPNKRLLNGNRPCFLHAASLTEAQPRTHLLWTRLLAWLCTGGWSQRPAASSGSVGFSHCLPGSAPAHGRQTGSLILRLMHPVGRGMKSAQYFALRFGCCQLSSSKQSN